MLAGAEGHPTLTLAAADRLRDHTHGHPLYLKALLRELPDDALAADRGVLPAPHSFSATVLRADDPNRHGRSRSGGSGSPSPAPDAR